jgi:ribosome-binding factor A
MPSQRIARVQRLLRAEISEVLRRKLKDPRIGMVSITEVYVSPDLKNARVYLSVLGEDASETLTGLRSAAGFIRAELMKVLHLRPIPVFEFAIDESLARGAHTLDLMDRIRHEQEDEPPRDGAGDRADRGE